tara:strand:- start:692 stop:1372 length:681 start_codon:yes stop_codon:yes gene_type:complete
MKKNKIHYGLLFQKTIKKIFMYTYKQIYWLNLPTVVIMLILTLSGQPNFFSLVLGGSLVVVGLAIRLPAWAWSENKAKYFQLKLQVFTRNFYVLSCFLIVLGSCLTSRQIELFPFIILVYSFLIYQQVLRKEKKEETFNLSLFFPQLIKSPYENLTNDKYNKKIPTKIKSLEKVVLLLTIFYFFIQYLISHHTHHIIIYLSSIFYAIIISYVSYYFLKKSIKPLSD